MARKGENIYKRKDGRASLGFLPTPLSLCLPSVSPLYGEQIYTTGINPKAVGSS